MEKAKTTRLHSMDSLRGLASLQVLFHHCLLISLPFYNAYNGLFSDASVKILTNSPLHILWAGHEAVIFFFVMSGFVLSIPYLAGKKLIFFDFLIKRVFRIYFPYLVSLFIGFGLYQLFYNTPRVANLSPWINEFYSEKISNMDLIRFVIYMKGYFHNVVTSLWSLPIEMKISIFFPFIVIFIRKVKFVWCCFILITNMLIYHVGKRLGMESFWPDFSLLYYFTFFILGGVLSKYYKTILIPFNKLSRLEFITLVLCTACMYTYKWNVKLFPEELQSILVKIPADYVVAFAAVLTLVIGVSDRTAKTFNNPILVSIGRISFSLYLIHPLVIGTIGFTLGTLFSPTIIIIICTALSLLLAYPFHYLIETPLQRLGQYFGGKFIR